LKFHLTFFATCWSVAKFHTTIDTGNCLVSLVSALTKQLQKATVGFFMSLRPHGKSRLLLRRLSGEFMLEGFVESVGHNQFCFNSYISWNRT